MGNTDPGDAARTILNEAIEVEGNAWKIPQRLMWELHQLLASPHPGVARKGSWLAEVFNELDWWKQRGMEFAQGTATVRSYIERLEAKLVKLERVVEAADIFCKTKAEEHWTLNIVYKKLEDALRGVGEE